ncbi:MAG: glycosyltransferase family 4 protein [Betaproteobacteria bacterium]|nr:glycosyltransferase family 4 protein [Betaproteobacteria bacterium]
MKLLYVFPEPLPLERARGIQTVFTVRSIAQQGIDTVLAHVPSDGDPFLACAIERPAGVELMPVSHRLPWPLARIHSNRIFMARLGARVRWGEIGVVMARHLKAARSLLERHSALPLIYEAHEVFADTVPSHRSETMAHLENFVVERAAVLIANSQATANRLRERYRGAGKIEVVPNGVDVPGSIPDKDWAHAGEHIVYAGSFFGWKGVEDLVIASRELGRMRITLMGGDGAAIERLCVMADSGGAQLDFTGRVSHERVAEALKHACIAVLPNRADPDSAFTSPIKLFEYMAAGCALVASDLPSVREILDEGEAAWVPPGDAKALARAIRGLAEDPARAQAMGARLRAKAARYSWDARGERLAGLLRPLLLER